MNGDSIVVDGVIHAYNWTEPNWTSKWSPGFSEAGYNFHAALSPDDDHLMTHEEFVSDWSGEQLEEILFTETNVDVGVFHSVPLYDYYKDGLSSIEKGAAMKERNPDRIVLYGNINPLDVQHSLNEIERQVNEYKISGLKLYPATFFNGQTLPNRLDDPQTGFAVIEKCLELGINVIAVHKAVPFGPAKFSAYQVDDIDEVASRYPEMNFEIVHAGMAWIEETCLLMARFPNVYANLEATAYLVVKRPRQFAEAIGAFLSVGGEERMIFASGCSFWHPQPAIDGLRAFEMPTDLIEGWGYPALTDEGKDKILGENFLRLHGIDGAELRKRIDGDKWAKGREDGLRDPWSAIRA